MLCLENRWISLQEIIENNCRRFSTSFAVSSSVAVLCLKLLFHILSCSGIHVVENTKTLVWSLSPLFLILYATRLSWLNKLQWWWSSHIFATCVWTKLLFITLHHINGVQTWCHYLPILLFLWWIADCYVVQAEDVATSTCCEWAVLQKDRVWESFVFN